MNFPQTAIHITKCALTSSSRLADALNQAHTMGITYLSQLTFSEHATTRCIYFLIHTYLASSIALDYRSAVTDLPWLKKPSKYSPLKQCLTLAGIFSARFLARKKHFYRSTFQNCIRKIWTFWEGWEEKRRNLSTLKTTNLYLLFVA